MRYNKGFTFIELLIAVALFSIVAVSVYFYLQTGIFLYARVGEGLKAINEYRLGFEKMDKELHNITFLDDVVFKGEEDILEFPACIEVYKQGERDRDCYKVTYLFKDKTLSRIVRPISQTTFTSEKEEKATLLSNVREGRFEYAYITPNGSIIWKESWTVEDNDETGKIIPYGVRVSFVPVVTAERIAAADRGASSRLRMNDMPKVTKTFILPLGTLYEVTLNE